MAQQQHVDTSVRHGSADGTQPAAAGRDRAHLGMQPTSDRRRLARSASDGQLRLDCLATDRQLRLDRLATDRQPMLDRRGRGAPLIAGRPCSCGLPTARYDGPIGRTGRDWLPGR